MLPGIKTTTMDNTGYVIETLNYSTMGPGGCVRVTTRDIWRLTATEIAKGEVTSQPEPQQEVSNIPFSQNSPVIPNERQMNFRPNEQQNNSPGYGFFMTPHVFNISTCFKTGNSSDDLSNQKTFSKKPRVVQMEDCACETDCPVTKNSESQTEFFTKEEKYLPDDTSANDKPCSSKQSSSDSEKEATGQDQTNVKKPHCACKTRSGNGKQEVSSEKYADKRNDRQASGSSSEDNKRVNSPDKNSQTQHDDKSAQNNDQKQGAKKNNSNGKIKPETAKKSQSVSKSKSKETDPGCSSSKTNRSVKSKRAVKKRRRCNDCENMDEASSANGSSSEIDIFVVTSGRDTGTRERNSSSEEESDESVNKKSCPHSKTKYSPESENGKNNLGNKTKSNFNYSFIDFDRDDSSIDLDDCKMVINNNSSNKENNLNANEFKQMNWDGINYNSNNEEDNLNASEREPMNYDGVNYTSNNVEDNLNASEFKQVNWGGITYTSKNEEDNLNASEREQRNCDSISVTYRKERQRDFYSNSESDMSIETGSSNDDYSQSDSSSSSRQHKSRKRQKSYCNCGCCSPRTTSNSSSNSENAMITDSALKLGSQPINIKYCHIYMNKKLHTRRDDDKMDVEDSSEKQPYDTSKSERNTTKEPSEYPQSYLVPTKDSEAATESNLRNQFARQLSQTESGNPKNELKPEITSKVCQSRSDTKLLSKDDETTMEVDVKKKFSGQNFVNQRNKKCNSKTCKLCQSSSGKNVLKKYSDTDMDVTVLCCHRCFRKASRNDLVKLRKGYITKLPSDTNNTNKSKCCGKCSDTGVSSTNKKMEMDVDYKNTSCKWSQTELPEQKDECNQFSTRPRPRFVQIRFDQNRNTNPRDINEDVEQTPSIKNSIKNFITRYLWGEPLTRESSTQVDRICAHPECDISSCDQESQQNTFNRTTPRSILQKPNKFFEKETVNGRPYRKTTRIDHFSRDQAKTKRNNSNTNYNEISQEINNNRNQREFSHETENLTSSVMAETAGVSSKDSWTQMAYEEFDVPEETYNGENTEDIYPYSTLETKTNLEDDKRPDTSDSNQFATFTNDHERTGKIVKILGFHEFDDSETKDLYVNLEDEHHVPPVLPPPPILNKKSRVVRKYGDSSPPAFDLAETPDFIYTVTNTDEDDIESEPTTNQRRDSISSTNSMTYGNNYEIEFTSNSSINEQDNEQHEHNDMMTQTTSNQSSDSLSSTNSMTYGNNYEIEFTSDSSINEQDNEHNDMMPQTPDMNMEKFSTNVSQEKQNEPVPEIFSAFQNQPNSKTDPNKEK